MKFDEHRDNWDALGRLDPLWAILTDSKKKGGGWDLDAFRETGRGAIAWVADHMSTHAPDVGRQRALDFGCGVGRLTQPLCNYFTEVVGVDIAESMIETARRINVHGESCRYVHNPSPDLGCFPDAHFDFVLSLLVLQHMPAANARTYVGEFLRVLRPGGYTFFQVATAAKDGVVPARGPRPDGQPVILMYALDPDEIRAIVAAGSARIVHEAEDKWAGPHWWSRHYTVRKL